MQICCSREMLCIPDLTIATLMSIAAATTRISWDFARISGIANPSENLALCGKSNDPSSTRRMSSPIILLKQNIHYCKSRRSHHDRLIIVFFAVMYIWQHHLIIVVGRARLFAFDPLERVHQLSLATSYPTPTSLRFLSCCYHRFRHHNFLRQHCRGVRATWRLGCVRIVMVLLAVIVRHKLWLAIKLSALVLLHVWQLLQ